MNIINKIKFIEVLRDKNINKSKMDCLISGKYDMERLEKILEHKNIFIENENIAVSMFASKLREEGIHHNIYGTSGELIRFMQFQKPSIIDIINNEYMDNIQFARYINYNESKKYSQFEDKDDFMFFLEVLNVTGQMYADSIYDALKEKRQKLYDLRFLIKTVSDNADYKESFLMECVEDDRLDIKTENELVVFYANWDSLNLKIVELTDEQFNNYKKPLTKYTDNALDNELIIVNMLSRALGDLRYASNRFSVLFKSPEISIKCLKNIIDLNVPGEREAAIISFVEFVNQLEDKNDLESLNMMMENGNRVSNSCDIYKILYDIDIRNIQVRDNVTEEDYNEIEVETLSAIKYIKETCSESVYNYFVTNVFSLDEKIYIIGKERIEKIARWVDKNIDIKPSDYSNLELMYVIERKYYIDGLWECPEKFNGINLSVKEFVFLGMENMLDLLKNDLYINFLKGCKKDRFDIIKFVRTVNVGISTSKIHFPIEYVFNLINLGKINNFDEKTRPINDYVNAIGIEYLIGAVSGIEINKTKFLLEHGIEYGSITPLTLESIFNGIAKVKNMKNMLKNMDINDKLSDEIIDNFILSEEFSLLEKYLKDDENSNHILDSKSRKHIFEEAFPKLIYDLATGSYKDIKFNAFELKQFMLNDINDEEIKIWFNNESFEDEDITIREVSDFKSLLSYGDKRYYDDNLLLNERISGYLFSNIDSNKKMIEILIENRVIARAVIRLCKIRYKHKDINRNIFYINRKAVLLEEIAVSRNFKGEIDRNILKIVGFVKKKASSIDADAIVHSRNYDIMSNLNPVYKDVEVYFVKSKYSTQEIERYADIGSIDNANAGYRLGNFGII